MLFHCKSEARENKVDGMLLGVFGLTFILGGVVQIVRGARQPASSAAIKLGIVAILVGLFMAMYGFKGVSLSCVSGARGASFSSVGTAALTAVVAKPAKDGEFGDVADCD